MTQSCEFIRKCLKIIERKTLWFSFSGLYQCF